MLATLEDELLSLNNMVWKNLNYKPNVDKVQDHSTPNNILHNHSNCKP